MWTAARLAKRPAGWKRNVGHGRQTLQAGPTGGARNNRMALAIWQAMPRNDHRAMNAYSSDFHRLGNFPQSDCAAASSAAEPRVHEQAPDIAGSIAGAMAGSMVFRWAALHDAAGAVAALANLPLDSASRDPEQFAIMIADAPSWKAGLLSDRLDDMAAFMQAGLSALLTVNAAGRNPAAAALALRHEFKQSRDALMDLAFEQ